MVATIPVRNLPESMKRRLRARTAMEGISMPARRLAAAPGITIPVEGI